MLRVKTFVLSMTILATSHVAWANDDVMIDLSVLNNLNSSDYYVENEPMFPVLPKRKAVPTAKHQAKPRKTPIIKEAKVVEKAKVKDIKRENIVPLAKNEEVVVVDVEPMSYPNPEVKPVVVPEIPKEVLAEEKISPKVENNVETTNNESAKIELLSPQQKEVVPVGEIMQQELPNLTNQNEETENASVSQALLVNNPTTESMNTKPKPENFNSLQFDEDEDELSAANQERIDEIVGKFKNEKNSKVAIYAYNWDNGVDSFRKKRACLNRAIEVRSYLLRKGFKNFSIKVINITEKSAKANSVEIEEL